MRKLVFLVCLLLAFPVYAKDFGVGLGFSTAGSGISGYAKANHNSFFQGMFGLTGPDPFVIIDYGVLTPLGDLTGYVGGGAIIQLGQRNTGLGVHIPFGLYYQARSVPLMVNADIAPGLTVGKKASAFVDLSLGLRFLF